jgi:hypothetical protein
MSANAENLTARHLSDMLGRQLLRGPGSLSGERVRQIEATLRAAIQKSLNDGFVAAAA